MGLSVVSCCWLAVVGCQYKIIYREKTEFVDPLMRVSLESSERVYLDALDSPKHTCS
jgi:hypothetical protein